MAQRLATDTLEEYLPDGPITSLRRVQTLYGALAEAAEDAGGDPAYSIYYTPGELDEFVAEDGDTDRYLARVDVDLTDQEPSVDTVSIAVERLTPDVVPKLGFARFPWGRGIDHSITRRGAKGGSDATTAATYCVDCLERWTNADGREPAVGAVAESHPDGWVIEALQDLSRDERVKEKIEQALEKQLSGTPRITATVRLKLDPATLSGPPGTANSTPAWFYPGQVDVLNAGMKARKHEKLARKNLSDSDPPSRGQGTCMVTEETTEVFGTADDPLALFTVQHAEKFSELKRENAWRAHAVSSDTALLIQSGTSLVEACRTTRNGLGVYTLPYFTEIRGWRRAELLYRGLSDLQDRDDEDSTRHPMAFIEDSVEKYGDEEELDDLRFYVLSLRNDSGDINVFHEVPDVTMYWPREIASEYLAVLNSPTFDCTSGFGTTEHWSLLSSGLDQDHIINAVVDGSFAWNAVPSTDSDDGAAVNDDIEWYTYQLLTGSSIPVERLLDMFLTRLAQERESDPENRLSLNRLKVQFAQLEALARADLLVADAETHAALTVPPTNMTTDDLDVSHLADADGSIPRPAARRYRLETFIQNRKALAENPERRAAFLVGVLVGQLSHHQQYTRDMNRTLRDQHQAENMTTAKLKRLYRDLIDKAGIYASEVDWGGEILFDETVDELTETVSAAVPGDDWSLSRQDLQFFYALGIGYGTRAEGRVSDLIDRAEAATAPPAE
mgnify:CR=1 FL=1